ncbi:hypothetical protein PHISCL_01328 [Aspergillus sclerotialis]|uniref:Cytochrome b mRNA-processing protein 4 n=1 Tax=Aspergillus sclerotialis TaxID=2070753 RepID=A0A3A3A8R5_9EURO|nr:hypothetical protein PHISCL_01328 [Aspergillus sclerotialis]
MPPAKTWLKMMAVGTVIVVGGPMFVQSIRPTDEELFQRYNPELQRRSIEEGPRRAQEFVDYTNKLKEWSKSDKSIWLAAKEQAAAQEAQAKVLAATEEKKKMLQKEEMRKELVGEK